MASTTLTNTAISETYVSILHSKGEVLPSTGQQWVYDGCGNRSSIKIGRDCSGLTVCGTLSADSIAATNWLGIINVVYPVGSVYLCVNGTSPSVLFSGTTWEQISQGRYLAGVGSGNDGTISRTLTAGNIYGEYMHTLTVDEMPAHNHVLRKTNVSENDDNTSGSYFGSSSRTIRYRPEIAASLSMDTAGGNQPHNNIPPGYAVYIWKRTA